jgi:hypothetical protein
METTLDVTTLATTPCDHVPRRHRARRRRREIDGNFSGVSGIAEMLMQWDAGEIRLLPALLPRGRPDG